MRRHRIAVIPGDGIGREVTRRSRCSRRRAAHGFALELTEHPWGCDHFVETGRMMPADALETLGGSERDLPRGRRPARRARPCLPVGAVDPDPPRIPPAREPPAGPPVAGRPSPVRDATPDSVDMVIVRENNEGEYSEIGGRLHRGTADEPAVKEAIFTRRGTDR